MNGKTAGANCHIILEDTV